MATNQSTAVEYQRGDTRRLLRVALAASDLDHPSLNNIAKETCHTKQTVLNDLKRLQVQLGVVISKDDFAYRISSWGPVISGPEGIRKLLSEGSVAQDE